MPDLESLRAILRYSDAANQKVLSAAQRLADEQLDRRFEMGMGTLRRTLVHIYNGEHVWLQRWQRKVETRWPAEDERVGVAELRQRFAQTWEQRDRYLGTLTDADLSRRQIYRDSRGSLFQASLRDMILQACIHSIHHRAQAVNMLRHLGAGLVELDYMYSVRQPVEDAGLEGLQTCSLA